MNNIKTKKGLTLIELIVVIAIIGLLSALGLVQLYSAREKARDSQRKADLAMLVGPLKVYYDSFGKYPDPNPNNGAAYTCTDSPPPRVRPIAGSLWHDQKDPKEANPLYDEYISGYLRPPGNNEGDYRYCYDTNESADPNPSSHFLLYTKLESSGKWFWIDGQGGSGEVDDQHVVDKCEMGTSCDW